MILDILQHTDDLQYCMDGVQAVGAMITALWIRQFFRYCRTNTSKSLIMGWSTSLLKLEDSLSQAFPTVLRK
jgi:hypothetical protein